MDVVNQLSDTVSSGLEYINRNKILSAVLGLFLVLYAALAAPKLPKSVAAYFDNTWVKLVFMFLIGYMATKDMSVAIIAAVALLVTLQTLSSQKVAAAVVAKVEGFANVSKRRFIEAFSEAVAEGATQEEAVAVAQQAVVEEAVATGASQEEAVAVAEAVTQQIVAEAEAQAEGPVVSEASALPMPPAVAPAVSEEVMQAVAPAVSEEVAQTITLPEVAAKVAPVAEETSLAAAEVEGDSAPVAGAMLSEVQASQASQAVPTTQVSEESLMNACGGPMNSVAGYEGSELAQF